MSSFVHVCRCFCDTIFKSTIILFYCGKSILVSVEIFPFWVTQSALHSSATTRSIYGYKLENRLESKWLASKNALRTPTVLTWQRPRTLSLQLSQCCAARLLVVGALCGYPGCCSHSKQPFLVTLHSDIYTTVITQAHILLVLWRKR
jgi:hypothetical protein